MAGFVLPIISGLAGLFGGLGKNQQTQTQNSTTNQSGSQSSATNPIFSELQQRLMQLFTGGAEDFYKQGTDLGPYTSQGLQNIAGQGNQNRQMLDAILAQRGLSHSPAASNQLTMNALNTGNQQSQFLSGIPLLQRQLQQGGLDQLLRTFSAIPTGSSSYGTSSGTSNTQGTSTSQAPGNPLAGLFGGVGAALPLAFPNLFGGQQQKQQQPLNAFSNFTYK